MNEFFSSPGEFGKIFKEISHGWILHMGILFPPKIVIPIRSVVVRVESVPWAIDGFDSLKGTEAGGGDHWRRHGNASIREYRIDPEKAILKSGEQNYKIIRTRVITLIMYVDELTVL